MYMYISIFCLFTYLFVYLYYVILYYNYTILKPKQGLAKQATAASAGFGTPQAFSSLEPSRVAASFTSTGSGIETKARHMACHGLTERPIPLN